MVEKDVFGYISRVSGCALTEQDLATLADACDPHPLAERIRVDVVVEVLAVMPASAVKVTVTIPPPP